MTPPEKNIGPARTRHSVAVIIPCHNECAAIGTVVHKSLSRIPCVIVVDDGSSDDTRTLAEQAGATVLTHPARQGKGSAISLGLMWAREKRYTWALLLDGDGQHDPDDMDAFLELTDTTNADLIIGDRMTRPTGMPLLRWLTNKTMSALISAYIGVSIPDSQCGYRLLRLSTLSDVSFSAKGFEIETEMIVKLAAKNSRILSIPTATLYGDEKSKIRPARDTFRWLRWFSQHLTYRHSK